KRVQYRQSRSARQQRPVGRDVHHLRRDSQRQCHAQGAVGRAPRVLSAPDSKERMRSVPSHSLREATRKTSREINRRIALNLIRVNQPISRADLARLMGTRRGAVSLLVGELIERGAVFEGATGEAKRGRKPTFLYIDSRERCVVAIDIRPTRTFMLVSDLVGHQLAS